MDYQETPYSGFKKLKAAKENSDCSFKFLGSRLDYELAVKQDSRVKLLYLLELIPIAVLIFFALKDQFYWPLIGIPVIVLLFPYIPRVRKLLRIGYLFCIAYPMTMDKCTWAYGIGISVIVLLLVQYGWSFIIQGKASEYLLSHQEEFERLWDESKLAIRANNTTYTHKKTAPAAPAAPADPSKPAKPIKYPKRLR